MIINNDNVLNELERLIKEKVTKEDVDKINTAIYDYIQNLEECKE